MTIDVGTSGWQYDSWKDEFYPPEVPRRRWLSYYDTRFSVVEVNNSFYQLPKETTFARWRDETLSEFRFVVKASRYITHIRRLRDCRDPVMLFWSRATVLGPKLGPVLFQLPPNFRVDPELLRRFLEVLPPQMRAAFEFRDSSWQQGEVTELLDRAGAAWVLADRPRWRGPLIVTGGWAYLRFHQGGVVRPGYSRSKLRAWAGRIAPLEADETYVFFNNDALAAAPRDAQTLIDLLEKRGLPVRTPRP